MGFFVAAEQLEMKAPSLLLDSERSSLGTSTQCGHEVRTSSTTEHRNRAEQELAAQGFRLALSVLERGIASLQDLASVKKTWRVL
jgi:hypothetical protein